MFFQRKLKIFGKNIAFDFPLSHLLWLLLLDGVQEHLQLEPGTEHVVEELVEDHGVDAGEEPADVEEAGGGHHGLVPLQDGAQDAAKVQAGVVGVADALEHEQSKRLLKKPIKMGKKIT